MWHSVLNGKALVGAFNQEKALVGAFSIIVKTDFETDGALHSTSSGDDKKSINANNHTRRPAAAQPDCR